MPIRVHIIGAGPGGLAAAMLLAQSGCDVTLFERQDRVGGRTSRIGDDRYRFDLGPTFFLYPHVLDEIFAACGRDLRREVELVRLDPQYHLIFQQGGELRATPDLDELERQISRLDPHDGPAVRRFIDDNRRKFAAFRPILQTPFHGLTDLLDPALLRAAPLLRPWRSVDGDLSRYFRDPRVRLAFSFQSKYLGMSPFQCPSLFTILSYLEYEHGVWHPIGGCNAITAAMARVATEMGVRIRLAEPVEGLLFDGSSVVGVRTPGGESGCDAVVMNADFAHAMPRLVPDHLRRRWSNDRIGRSRFSCSTFMMYLGLEGRCDELEHHTIWLGEHYRDELENIETRHRLTETPSCYFQNAARTDPTLAPPGHSTLYCLIPVTHRTRHVDWTTEAPRIRAALFHRLEHLGLRGLERRVRYERIITPHDWEQTFGIHLGATFNLAHSLDQMLHRRPGNRFGDVQNLYLVGGGTHPGSGLPVIFESARISTRLLLDDHGINLHWASQTGVHAGPASVCFGDEDPKRAARWLGAGEVA